MFKNRITQKLFLLVAGLGFIVSCSEGDTNYNSDDSNGNGLTLKREEGRSILDDPEFLDFLKDEYYFFSKVKDGNKIKSYIADDKIDKEEAKDIDLAFGFASQKDFDNFTIRQRKRYENLDKNYNLSLMQEADRNYLFSQGSIKISLPSGPPNTTLDCDGTFHFCNLAAMSAAALAMWHV